MISTPVTHHLDQIGIPYTIFTHASAPNTLEQAARERGQRPEQIVRSILFRLSKETYLMALIAGPNQISWPRLREYTHQSRLTLASKEEVLQVTGYPLGAVSPFGLTYPLRLVADMSVFQEEEISIGSGIRGVAIIIHSALLRQAFPEMAVLFLTTA